MFAPSIDFIALLLFLQLDFNLAPNSTIGRPQMPFLALLLSPSFSPKSSPILPPKKQIEMKNGETNVWAMREKGVTTIPAQIDDDDFQMTTNSADCEEQEGTTEGDKWEVEGDANGEGDWAVSGETEGAKTTRMWNGGRIVDGEGNGGRIVDGDAAGKGDRIQQGIKGGESGLRIALPFGECFQKCSQLCSNPKLPPPPPSPCPPCFGTTARPKNRKGGTTTEQPFYYEYEAAPDITQFGRCNVSVIVDQAQRIVVDLLFYAAAAWVPFWAFLCIAVNMNCRQFGHHRFLDFYQELAFIVLFPFMGIFVLKPQLELLCLITSMVLLFCLVFILVIGFLQAYFASSLIKGTSLKDGHLPVAVNYVWPLVLASIPVGVSVWMLRPQIASNGVHCFAPIHSDLFWAFCVPACLLWLLMLIRNQLSITACKQSRPAVDREQLYWARKSVKGTPLLLCWFLLTFFTQLFAVDMQLLWLCILFVLQSAILGPLLFLLHTHNHQKVNNSIFDRTQMGLYRPCPLRRQPVQSGPPLPPPAPPSDLPPPDSVQPPQTVLPPSQVPMASKPASRPSSTPGSAQLASFIQSSPMAAVQPQSILKRTQQWKEKAKSSGAGENQQKKEQKEEEGAPGETGGDANAQHFYEWLTDSDERNLRESERVLWHRPGLFDEWEGGKRGRDE